MRSLAAAPIACAVSIACSGGDAAGLLPAAEVDPLTGSGGLGFSVGSIPPGPALPFGLARPGPDTATRGGAPDFSHCAGYWYEDTEIRGFSQLHAAGTGVPDYGLIMFMPALDLASGPIDPGKYSARLDHRLERASPGYYGVQLVPSAVDVELSATLRTAVYRVTYPASGEASLVVDLAHGLGGTTLESDLAIDAGEREVTGSVLHRGALAGPDGYRVFFAARFDRSFAGVETYSAGQRSPGSISAAGPAIGALLSFGSGLPDPVRFQVGLSFIDLATARENLALEWVDFDLERARDAARDAWDAALHRIELEGGTPEHRRRFYTALYHAQLMPTLFTEAGNKYRGLDGQVHRAEDFTYFSDFSLWDTFRTFHPLITLIDPARERDFVRSLLAMTAESGRVPKWPLATVETDTMIGYHGETVLIDSWQKGVRGFDAEGLYAVLRASAMPEGGGEAAPGGRRRDCLPSYVSEGYCPVDQEGGSASKTLENAFADFMLGRLAEELGHAADAEVLAARAGSWSMLINGAGRVQGRTAAGEFAGEFREDLFADEFVEGNSRQWTVFVPHDVAGLAEEVGSDRFLLFLEELFENAAAAEKTPLPDLWYWHGNEPDIHAAYMFAELGRADLTEKWVRWIIDHRYANGPAGLDGNDDGGTLSAWYVFSALGLYPKVGEARYVLGAPLFPRATIHLPEGRTFTIRAEGWSARASRVRSVRLNGVAVAGPFVAHEELLRGGELLFEVFEP